MEVTFATLVIDWLDEHYPSIYTLKDYWLPSNNVHKVLIGPENKHLGRFTDKTFIKWIYGNEFTDRYEFIAADPEFFEKFDYWLNSNFVRDI